MGEFGDKFRKARENKSMTLDAVSNVTKISARMLQAIEEERFDQLPGGVFNKGFIRAYARHLGINDEDAVSEYLACLRRAQVEAQAVWEPPARLATQVRRAAVAPVVETAKVPSPAHLDELPELQLPRAEHVRPPRQNFLDKPDRAPNWRLLAVAVLVLLLLVVLRRRHSAVELQAKQPAAAAPTATVESRPASSAVGLTATPINPAPRVAAPNHPSQSNGLSGGHSGNATGRPTAAKLETQTSAPPPADNLSGDKAGAQVSSQPVGGAPVPPVDKAAASPLTLVIRATENSWISISSDGKTASHETLIAPAATSVHASREIVAKVGNAAGVTFLWNGQEIQPQGAESEVKTFVFDANGMRVVGAGPGSQQNP